MNEVSDERITKNLPFALKNILPDPFKTSDEKKPRVKAWRSKRIKERKLARQKNDKEAQARDKPKAFFCSKCNQGFTMKSNCMRHERYECGQKPRFMCPYCKVKCKQTSQIYVHIRRKHPNNDIYVISIEPKDKKKDKNRDLKINIKET